MANHQNNSRKNKCNGVWFVLQPSVEDPPLKGNDNKSSSSDEKGKGKGNRKGTSGHAASDTEVSSCHESVLFRVCLC